MTHFPGGDDDDKKKKTASQPPLVNPNPDMPGPGAGDYSHSADTPIPGEESLDKSQLG